MRHWVLITLFSFVTIFGSGCLMMHKSMHDTNESHARHETRSSAESEQETGNQTVRSGPNDQHSDPKKPSKTWFILGGIGMGLMMMLMFL